MIHAVHGFLSPRHADLRDFAEGNPSLLSEVISLLSAALPSPLDRPGALSNAPPPEGQGDDAETTAIACVGATVVHFDANTDAALQRMASLPDPAARDALAANKCTGYCQSYLTKALSPMTNSSKRKRAPDNTVANTTETLPARKPRWEEVKDIFVSRMVTESGSRSILFDLWDCLRLERSRSHTKSRMSIDPPRRLDLATGQDIMNHLESVSKYSESLLSDSPLGKAAARMQLIQNASLYDEYCNRYRGTGEPMAVLFARAILCGGKWRAQKISKGGSDHGKLKEMWNNYLKAARPWCDIVEAFGVGIFLILPVDLSNEKWVAGFSFMPRKVVSTNTKIEHGVLVNEELPT